MPRKRRVAASSSRTGRGKLVRTKRKTTTPRRAAKRPVRPARAVAPPPAADPRLVAAGWQGVRLSLREHGLLLQSDAALPNVAALVAGEPVSGSWWAHPASHSIYAVTERLAAHPDALAVKLVGGKTTWVHRRLWAPLLAVATAREPWQTRGLSAAARALLARLQREGELRASGEPARELQARLLALGEEQHGEGGAHEMKLVSWERWKERDVMPPQALSPERSRMLIEEALRTLGGEGALARLPWVAARRPAKLAAVRRTSRSRPEAST
jgi:hypothetical protein